MVQLAAPVIYQVQIQVNNPADLQVINQVLVLVTNQVYLQVQALVTNPAPHPATNQVPHLVTNRAHLQAQALATNRVPHLVTNRAYLQAQALATNLVPHLVINRVPHLATSRVYHHLRCRVPHLVTSQVHGQVRRRLVRPALHRPVCQANRRLIVHQVHQAVNQAQVPLQDHQWFLQLSQVNHQVKVQVQTSRHLLPVWIQQEVQVLFQLISLVLPPVTLPVRVMLQVMALHWHPASDQVRFLHPLLRRVLQTIQVQNQATLQVPRRHPHQVQNLQPCRAVLLQTLQVQNQVTLQVPRRHPHQVQNLQPCRAVLLRHRQAPPRAVFRAMFRRVTRPHFPHHILPMNRLYLLPNSQVYYQALSRVKDQVRMNRQRVLPWCLALHPVKHQVHTNHLHHQAVTQQEALASYLLEFPRRHPAKSQVRLRVEARLMNHRRLRQPSVAALVQILLKNPQDNLRLFHR